MTRGEGRNAIPFSKRFPYGEALKLRSRAAAQRTSIAGSLWAPLARFTSLAAAAGFPALGFPALRRRKLLFPLYDS